MEIQCGRRDLRGMDPPQQGRSPVQIRSLPEICSLPWLTFDMAAEQETACRIRHDRCRAKTGRRDGLELRELGSPVETHRCGSRLIDAQHRTLAGKLHQPAVRQRTTPQGADQYAVMKLQGGERRVWRHGARFSIA